MINSKILEFENAYDKAQEFVRNKSFETYFSAIAAKYDICIFGGGALGQEISEWLISAEIFPTFYCDNNIAMKNVMLGNCIPYITFEELEKRKNTSYIIVAVANRRMRYNDIINKQLQGFPHVWHNPLGITVYQSQIFDISRTEFLREAALALGGNYFREQASINLYEQLLKLRLQKEIVDYDPHTLDPFYYDTQYIIKELIDYSKMNTYVDCGAFTGDSLDSFIGLNIEAEYYLFEIDSEIYKLLLNHVENQYQDKRERIHIYPYGVGKKHEVVYYQSDLTGGSKIADKTESSSEKKTLKKAEIVALDEMKFDKKIDFIKMDIEGAEEEALMGCKKIISRDHPILAVSMYHSLSQFIKIPKLILELEPNYELYLRHHKHTIDDTVCYAIYKGGM